MKKQFFYAAFAIAMMASCTSEDNVAVDPIAPDAEDKVAIELGIDVPTVNASVSGRAVGSVGDIEDEEGAAVKKNVWKGQQLHIAMIDNDDESDTYGEIAKVDNAEVLPSTYYYYAPREDDATNSGSIRIYGTELENGNDQGVLQRIYYPIQGKFDFLGWHIDDATDGTESEGVPGKPTVTITKDQKTVKNIVITGQQDIMGARTKDFTEENYWNENITATYTDMSDWNFSARTARNKIHPILEFKHQLARLKFFVKAGSESAAEYIYTPGEEGAEGTWAKRPIREQAANETTGLAAINATEAMYVTSISATGMLNTLEMNLADTDEEGKKVVTTKASTTSSTAEFKLLSRDESTNTMKGELDHVAPAIWTKSIDNLKEGKEIADVTEGEDQEQQVTTPGIDLNDFEKGTPVGESIMFLPFDASNNALTSINLSMALEQVVELTDNETITVGAPKDPQQPDGEKWTESDKYTWGKKSQTANLTVRAKDVKIGDSYATAFEPGKSYNVYITIYGFERIVITAELTAWDNGGDVEVDIEDKVSNSDNLANEEEEEGTN